MTIEVRDLVIERGEFRLLDRISTVLRLGELTAIVGANGAGKTTLARCLAGELPPDEGEIQLGGKSLGEFSAHELAMRRAVLPQLSGLDFGFSVEEVVRMGRIPHKDGRTEGGKAAIQRAIEAMELETFAHRLYSRLSGGERQRVHMARVLAQVDGVQDGWLMLDEPTSALDLKHKHRLLDAVRSFVTSGGGAVVVLHDLNLALRCAEHVLLLNRGRLVASGQAPEVLTEDRLSDVFEVQVRRHSGADGGLILTTGPTP